MAIAAASTVAAPVVEHVRVVRERKSPSYDYEKVFWNSLYSMGLVGLGWLALQLGNMIQGVKDATEDIPRLYTGDASYITFRNVYDWVEGDKASWAVNVPVLGLFLYATVIYLRANPNVWEQMKMEAEAKHPEWFDDKGKMIDTSQSPAEKLLGGLNTFYNEWGAALPIGCVGLQMALEYFRVRRFKKEQESVLI